MTKNDLAPLGWISTSERMPPESADELLVYSAGHRVSMQTGYYVHGLARAAQRDNEPMYYTHWQPLPPGPGVEPIGDLAYMTGPQPTGALPVTASGVPIREPPHCPTCACGVQGEFHNIDDVVRIRELEKRLAEKSADDRDKKGFQYGL